MSGAKTDLSPILIAGADREREVRACDGDCGAYGRPHRQRRQHAGLSRAARPLGAADGGRGGARSACSPMASYRPAKPIPRAASFAMRGGLLPRPVRKVGVRSSSGERGCTLRRCLKAFLSDPPIFATTFAHIGGTRRAARSWGIACRSPGGGPDYGSAPCADRHAADRPGAGGDPFDGAVARRMQTLRGEPVLDEADTIRLVVQLDRAELHRAGPRFERMMGEGALDEVRTLSELQLDPDLPAMRAIGVRPLMRLMRG